MDYTIVERVLDNLSANGFKAIYFDNKEAAAGYIASLVSPGMTVGVPGSVTLQEMGIVPRIEEHGGIALEHGKATSPADADRLRDEQGRCDLFLSSTNALTEQGYLVNCDGRGNRVSAMIYGPKKVVVACGVNKICKDIDGAMERIEHIAGPRNSERLKLEQNPCCESGVCMDCSSPTRVCRAWTIIKMPLMGQDFTVVLINEELGY